METRQEHTALEAETDARGEARMTRREALSLVGKHAVYTAPAVLAILSATKSNSAHADTGPGTS